MGACQSTLAQRFVFDGKMDKVDREQIYISRKIDDDLKKEAESNTTVIKLLLLGPGESGKSTVLKQMRIIHQDGFTDSEKLARREAVYSNVVQCMNMLLAGVYKCDLEVQPKNEVYANMIREICYNHMDGMQVNEEIAEAIRELWDDKGCRAAYEMRNRFQLNDSAYYFFDAVDRIKRKDYIPTVQDILMTRVATTGVQEIQYNYKNIDFKIFDVGGQKSERRKWIHCFDNVNAILFVVAISEYDQTLREDGKTNRIKDSQTLFSDVVNSPYFISAQVILFMNKKDLFADKIKRVPLTTCFAKYAGPNEYEKCTTYIQKRFERLKNDPEKMIYSHLTCATDTNQVQLVLISVTDMIIAENFKQTGVM